MTVAGNHLDNLWRTFDACHMVAAEGYSIVWVQRINTTCAVLFFDEIGIILLHLKLNFFVLES